MKQSLSHTLGRWKQDEVEIEGLGMKMSGAPGQEPVH